MSARDNEVKRVVSSATAVAGVMIAYQVAGKATRDAFFLSHYDVTHLPTMLVAASVLSLLAALAMTRAMSKRGPAVLVPPAFAISGAALMVEWGLTFVAPHVVAVVFYLHIAVLGALLISGFWSVFNELLDPRTARRFVGRVGAGSALGGVIGGLIAERVGAGLSVPAMIPILAALHFVCAFGMLRLRSPSSRKPANTSSLPSKPAESTESPFAVLRKMPYLRNLSGLVLLTTITAAFLDYVFKAEASARFTNGEDLLRFFAIFHTILGVATFILQFTLSRRALKWLGLSRTVGSLPAASAVSSFAALLVPGLHAVTLARGTEGAFRSSLYRSGYEVLYTPLAPSDKRATKTIIDVGFERLGDAIGGGLAKLILVLLPAIAHPTLLGLAISFSILAVLVTRQLKRGYVKALEDSLKKRAIELDLTDVTDSTTQTAVLETLGAVDLREALEKLSADQMPSPLNTPDLASSGDAATAEPRLTPRPATRRPDSASRLAASLPVEPIVARIGDLRSGDLSRVRNALEQGPLDRMLVSQVIPLLAWDDASEHAIAALRDVAAKSTGQLVDALVDRSEEFAIRRRVPRALCWARNQRAFDGLLRGLQDRRFEVRFQCGRGLAHIKESVTDIHVDTERIQSAVKREVAVDSRVWRSQRLLDRVDDEGSPFVDEFLRERADRSLEHVFTMLSLILPKEPLTISYKGLHTDDATLRGTALEYLESVLPSDIKDALWPFLKTDRKRREPTLRSRQTILDDLMRSNRSIQLNLAALRDRLGKK